MINPNELWVGDLIQIKSKGTVGKYHSHKGDLVTINCKGVMVTAPKYDIRNWKQPKVEKKIIFEDDINSESKGGKLQDSIDLHIHILAPHMEHQSQARILREALPKSG